MKFGLECEFFVRKSSVGGYVLLGGLDASLTPDECGFLAEARGKPCSNIRDAVFSLYSDIYRLEGAAKQLGVELLREPNADVPYEAVLASRRRYNKGTIQFQNIYGFSAHRQKRKKTAGIHVSVTDSREHRYSSGRVFQYNAIWDFPQFIRQMDSAFKQEIKDAQRNPGFYEIKPDHRIEYRSLPNNVKLERIIEVVETIFT